MDKGGDNNFEHEFNFINYGKFFIENNLDGFVLFSYDISAFNFIRTQVLFRFWRFLSSDLCQM